MIKGKRIYLRLIERSDINILYNICNDNSVAKYNNVLPRKNYLFNNFHIIRKAPNKFLTIINEKGVIVGFMDYRSYYDSIYTIGVTIAKRFWRRGYGKESIETLTDYLFNELKVKQIIVEVMKRNIKAIECCKSCGFIGKESIEKDGESIIRMFLLKKE